ncbi:hypothetical protein L917_20766 [Phytophthora nicotianae]|uniref:Uncharacterized protein n=1 Tax=Phytophthora nicotianae TaxID=4792 RepID=W2JZW1_PHYNI|nr:hypothetical protein L917_20766 [Phytophthora nicotianae]
MTAEKEALMGSQTAKNLQLAVRPKHGSEQTTRQLVAAKFDIYHKPRPQFH